MLPDTLRVLNAEFNIIIDLERSETQGVFTAKWKNSAGQQFSQQFEEHDLEEWIRLNQLIRES